MSDPGEIIQVSGVRFLRALPGPVERVWAILTEPARLPGWYGEDGTIEGREGGAVRLMGGHIRGVVTRWRPARCLAYSWNVFDPGEDESAYPESYLTLDLAPLQDTVRLTLTHLPVPDQFDAQTRMGWHTYLDLVEAVADGRAPPDRQALMSRNAERYGVDLQNLQR